MVDLGYSPLPPNLVQEDFWAIGRLNGGKEPPPVSSATCKNPYVDGQIVLPGEPTIIGESTTTIAGPPPGSPAAKAAASAAAAAAGTTGGAAGGVAGGATAGVSSGTSEGTAGSAGSTILTPAQLAQGDRLVDGQIVKTSPCEAVQRFLCAIRLDSAATRIGGVPLPESLGWVLALLAVFIALPLFGLVGWPMIKRRRQGSEDDTYGDGLTSPSLDGGGRS
jgi:hypothetical protein